jgi:hypothetical protein
MGGLWLFALWRGFLGFGSLEQFSHGGGLDWPGSFAFLDRNATLLDWLWNWLCGELSLDGQQLEVNVVSAR